MASQVTGYRYFSNFLLFIGNPIEKMFGINFDKRGWLSPFVDKDGNALEKAAINSPSLYGENEGGVAGIVHVQYGTGNQEVLQFYKDHMGAQGLPASAYPYQSYLAFTGAGGFDDGGGWVGGVIGALMPHNNSAFYLGNSGYMKEMLLWPKRTRVRNDGRGQWYKVRTNSDGGEDIVCEVYAAKTAIAAIKNDALKFNVNWELITDAEPFIHTKNNKLVYYNGESDVVSSESDGVLTKGNPSSYVKPFDVYLKAVPECDGLSEFHATLIVIGQSYSYEVYGGVYSDAVISENTENGEKTVVISGVVDNSSGLIGIHLNVSGMILSDGVPTICAKASFSFSRPKDKIYYRDTSYPDINPIHKIREILTDDTAMNKPESDVNDINFMKAADQIWDEGLGVSWAITEKSCMDAINELCAHIEAGVRINRQTGLYEVVLFRDDWFDEDEIHILPQSKIKSLQLEVQNADEAINQLNVSYYNREAIKDSSFSISENAAIKNLQGRVNAEEVKFPYFMNQRNATVVAQWKLKQLSTPAWSGTFTTGFYDARKWNRYDIVKISWPKKNITDLPVRIMSINLGDGINNTVTIDFIEVVPYSSNLSSSVVIDTPIDTTPLPPQPALFKSFELSYFEAVQLNGQRVVDDELEYNPDIGYAAVIAQRPQNNSLNALMYTSAGGEYEKSGVIQYCETAVLDQDISRMSSSFAVKNAGNIGSVRVGSQITINDETMVYLSFDAVTKVLTVKRGALDTLPQQHASGSILYFADDFVAVDPTEYAISEVIDVKTLTTTPSGVLSLEEPGQKVHISGRAIRPYPAANVKINGEYWPEIIRRDAPEIEITWVNRSRIQQTGGEIIGWYDGDVLVEPGVEYIAHVYDMDSLIIQRDVGLANILSFNSELVTSGICRVQIFSKRDQFSSLQYFDHKFIVENSKVIFIFDETGDYTPPTAMNVDFTEQ